MGGSAAVLVAGPVVAGAGVGARLLVPGLSERAGVLLDLSCSRIWLVWTRIRPL